MLGGPNGINIITPHTRPEFEINYENSQIINDIMTSNCLNQIPHSIGALVCPGDGAGEEDDDR